MKRIFAVVLLLLSFASVALADGSDPTPPFKKTRRPAAFQPTNMSGVWPVAP